MNEPDVQPTVQIIREMADHIDRYSNELRHIANKMSKSEDLDYAADAVNAIRNMNANLRTDLLVTRPIRAYRQIEKYTD